MYQIMEDMKNFVAQNTKGNARIFSSISKGLFKNLKLFFGVFLWLMLSITQVQSFQDVFATQLGLSGAIRTPSPFTRRIEEGASVYSVNFFQQRDVSTYVVDQAARHYSAFSVGATDQIEAVFGQEFYTGSANKKRSYFWNFKYAFPNDSLPFAFSFVMPTRSYDWSSIMATAGWRQFYFGLGTNVGGRELREADVQAGMSVGVAHFGGYRMFRRYSYKNTQQNVLEVVGRPDEIYFVAGGEVPLGKNFHWLYDYDGDLFSSGIRLTLDTLSFQVSWTSSGDYDTLFLRNQDNILASAQYRF